MMIRLETSKRTGIYNNQLADIPEFDRKWASQIPTKYPGVRQRTDMSVNYNCHGLTFASRRSRVTDTPDIYRILADDRWIEVTAITTLMGGDVVIYFDDDGDANHSGIVIAYEPGTSPVICSKWGNCGEYVHLVSDHPPFYGPITK